MHIRKISVKFKPKKGLPFPMNSFPFPVCSEKILSLYFSLAEGFKLI